MADTARTAILFAVPGTSCPEAEVAFRNITEHARRRFPGTSIYWAYTSEVVRRRLSERSRHVDSPTQALEQIREEGITHLVVHPLHTVAGTEYDDLAASAAEFQQLTAGKTTVHVGMPLLLCRDEFIHTVRVLVSELCSRDNKDEALVLMAHGTQNKATAKTLYNAAKWCRELDTNVFMGTLIRPPLIDEVVEGCQLEGIKRAFLAPLMIVAGYTARCELAGQGDDTGNSWYRKLSEAGIDCRPAVKGLGEYDRIVETWLDRIQPTINAWTP
jgi:sirohydrochlorin cobaltochelatase